MTSSSEWMILLGRVYHEKMVQPEQIIRSSYMKVLSLCNIIKQYIVSESFNITLDGPRLVVTASSEWMVLLGRVYHEKNIQPEQIIRSTYMKVLSLFNIIKQYIV